MNPQDYTCPNCGATLSYWDKQGKVGGQTFYKCSACGEMTHIEEEEG